jgi:hypothetical protein
MFHSNIVVLRKLSNGDMRLGKQERSSFILFSVLLLLNPSFYSVAGHMCGLLYSACACARRTMQVTPDRYGRARDGPAPGPRPPRISRQRAVSSCRVSMTFRHYAFHCLGSGAAISGDHVGRDCLYGVLPCGLCVESADIFFSF